MTDQAMTLEIRDGIGHVTLSQPDRGNPLDLEFCLQLSRIATECDENAQVRAVLIDADLGPAAWDLAAELARGPTRSFGEIKNLLLSTWEQPIEAQMELEARAMARVCRTEDAWTGITEVAARRTPEFRGR
jgi:2-(1,2-epoxy-1,2-dihydrophenyl)acetyl-CoA isomerase